MMKTKRLTIKPYQERDREAMIDLLTNEQIKETYMIPDLPTEDMQNQMFEKLLALSVSPDHCDLGIFLEDHLIGFVNDVMMDGKTMELGYVIHPNYHHQGYASETLQAVINYLFQKGYQEVIAGAFESNKNSFGVMKKCGMKRIDKSEDIEYHGVLHHCIYYSIKNK